MKLTNIAIKNIRSHIATEITFKDGFNCIVGGVGDGKSSILYGIDFALFGERLGRSYDYLLREGETSGSVELTFEHKGKTYSIQRALTKERDRIIQDTTHISLYEDGKLVASGKKAAVDEEVSRATGLDINFFREVTWIQQERLKEFLLIEPSRRQSKIDELLGLSEFDTCYTNLRFYQSAYEGELAAYEQDPDIVKIEDMRLDYENREMEFVEAQKEIATLESQLVSLEGEMQKAEENLKQLEEQRARVEELKREESVLKTMIQNYQEELNHLESRLHKQRDLVNSLQADAQKLDAEESNVRSRFLQIGVSLSTTPNELKKIIDCTENNLKLLAGEESSLERGIVETRQRLELLREKSDCPLCLQPLSEEHMKNVLGRLKQYIEENQRRILELQREIEKNSKKLLVAKEVMQKLVEIKVGRESVQKRLDEEVARAGEDEKRKETLQIELEKSEENLLIVLGEIAKFDARTLEEARASRDKALEAYSDTKNEVKAANATLAQIENMLSSLKEKLDYAEKKLTRKDKVKSILGIVETLRDAYKTVRPHLRTEYINVLRSRTQNLLDEMLTATDKQLLIDVDENYSPLIRGESNVWRDSTSISGGERTLLAFAYKIALGQLIVEAKTGESPGIIILDEPTESLGPEDGSISRLAESLTRLKGIEQIIAVTHSEDFAEKAEHLIRARKEAGISTVIEER